MTTGKSDFPIKLDRKAIAKIGEISKKLRIDDLSFIRNSSVDDVAVAYVILALKEFLLEQRCQPDFTVVLSE